MKSNLNKEFSFRKYAWQQFKRNKPAMVSLYILFFLVFIAIFSPFLANDQPLYMKYKGESFYPAFSTLWDESKTDSVLDPSTNEHIVFQYSITDWRTKDLESVVWPLVAYSPKFQDRFNRDYVGPGDKQYFKNHNGEKQELSNGTKHYLGTDKLGRDVASGLIHATKISLLIGLVSMGIATVIGVLLGAFAGFYGDHGLTTSRAQFWMGVLGLVLGYFYAFVARSLVLKEAFEEGIGSGVFHLILSLIIWLGVFIGLVQLGKLLRIGSFMKAKVNVAIDAYISRGIEILNSLPMLILIIIVSAMLSEKSIWSIMVIIGLTSWTGVARLMRAEMLRIRQMEYIQAGRALGFSNARLIFKHGVPNGLAPVFVTFAFGVASAILTESGLSFLGIGMPDDVVTWGGMLSMGQQEFEAWWLVIYPGLAIFITITIYNLIGEGLRDALDPKMKD